MADSDDPTITLSEAEQEIVKTLAQKRYEINREQDVKDRKIGDQSNKKVDRQGMAGELAAAKHLNLYPDLTIQVTQGGIDLTLENGTTIDVKTTEYSDGQLLAPQYKKRREHANIFLLVTGEIPEYKIRGWEKAETLMNEQNLKWIGNKAKSYALTQDELNSVNQL